MKRKVIASSIIAALFIFSSVLLVFLGQPKEIILVATSTCVLLTNIWLKTNNNAKESTSSKVKNFRALLVFSTSLATVALCFLVAYFILNLMPWLLYASLGTMICSVIIEWITFFIGLNGEMS